MSRPEPSGPLAGVRVVELTYADTTRKTETEKLLEAL